MDRWCRPKACLKPKMSILPVPNCLVLTPDNRLARALERSENLSSDLVPLLILDTNERIVLPAGQLRSGFQIGFDVEHISTAPTRASLGTGKVLNVRTLGENDQVLVQLSETGEARWLRFQTLRIVMPVSARLAAGAVGPFDDHAERFRLRTLAQALKSWDSNTGAFGRLDIDPLPHQLHVAQRVVTSGDANWLIADDVGLGKTIEVGLIIHALAQRNRCRRVLIICPAGLVRQWKEEMFVKFERRFEIYKHNFMPDSSDELRLRDNVIVSLDLVKRDEHLELFLQAGTWDLVVFDEAHRLGRSETGERTARYSLAESLRRLTPSMLLLTATPHQGKTRRFGALLELVRPDLRRKIASLEANPEIVGDIVIRNRKTLVTDAVGNPIFRGHDTRRFRVPPSQLMQAFDRELQTYLTRGYGIGSRAGASGRAVGFVMTTYRKLASSSVAAIERALKLRRERLRTESDWSASGASIEEVIESGDLENLDGLAELEQLYAPKAFFNDEADQIDRLVRLAEAARDEDAKLTTLLDEVLAPLLEAGENLLVFTEYRATQSYLAQAIKARFPDVGQIASINGSMALDEKISNVDRFNNRHTRVLISTEAGGEGLNLQQSCHVLVNYDLPWNPSRLVQRIGRLYRYGQQRRVQVLNLQADDTFDNQAINLMVDRVATIAKDMAAVESTNREAMEADILGELLSCIDMETILERAETQSIELTSAELSDAIESAKEARRIEQDILQFADRHEGSISGALTAEHMEAFVEGMLPRVGGRIRARTHQDKVIELELPENLVGEAAQFGKRSIIRVTTNRRIARELGDVFPLDFENPLVVNLVRESQDRREFDGLYAETSSDIGCAALGVFHVRWQDDEGVLLEDELLPIELLQEGKYAQLNDEAFGQLLLSPLFSAPRRREPEKRLDPAAGMYAKADQVLAERSTAKRMPGSLDLLAAIRRIEEAAGSIRSEETEASAGN